MFTSAQQDFNYYKSLESVGKIPADFSVRTSAKIEEEMKGEKENLSQKEKKVFLDGIHYGIDEILQSGLVIYGDEISEYVQKIANKLLERDSDLRKKLRFYTVKSNESNAFSTDQGIIFVTTGLVSQVSSEAQLAYILAHEISHYIEKHVVEGFEYRTRNKGINKQIAQLSIYSKEKEFEADSLGVKIFYKAGYSRSFVNSTFDVLIYSYLPIDEIKFPKNYYNSETCFIPEKKFADKEYPIKAEEDYDDTESTHPNALSRKKRTNSVADKLKDWGTASNFFGEDKFLYIRNLARFERVRSDIIEYQYGSALYTIFILEREFPESLYLTRMKAQCWYGLSVMKQANKINKTVDSRKNLEGEGAGMHVLLKNLREAELTTIAVRVVEDCRLKFPNDPELLELSKRTNKSLFTSDKFKLENYQNITFQAASAKALIKDTVNEVTKENVDDENLTKVQKLKLKKSKISTREDFDSTDYYYYILSDLVTNESFLNLQEETQSTLDEIDAKAQAYLKLSRSERSDYNDEKNKKINQVDLSEFILVDPAVISYKKGRVDRGGSEKMEERVIDGFQFVSDKLDLKMTSIGKGNLDKTGTEGFNDKSFFTSMLIQVANAEGVDVFPVDYSRISTITKEYGTNKLVFSVFEHQYRVKVDSSPLWFVVTLPNRLIKGNETYLNLIVLDLDKAKVVTGSAYYFREPMNQYNIENRLYDIFQQKNKPQ
jgi:predicted Zn-dependent protease